MIKIYDDDIGFVELIRYIGSDHTISNAAYFWRYYERS